MKEKTKEQLAYIGACVSEHRAELEAWKAKMRPTWILEGQHLRELREELGIPRRHVAQKIHVSDGVLYRLENGDAIKRRPLVLASYKTAIELVLAKREIAIHSYSE